MSKRVLVVDDEKLIVKGIEFSLTREDMIVDAAYDGITALSMVRENEYDIILLDIMLPEMDGLTVCQIIREFSNVPIIMLTAKDNDLDKIMGLEYGADDYMTKPFNVLELKARIKAILRRNDIKNGVLPNQIIAIDELKLDTKDKRAFIYDKDLMLTVTEFDLFEIFVKNPGKVYSRDELLKLVWGYDYSADGRTVDVHIRRLREKVEKDPGAPKYLHTKWGVGYYFEKKE